MSDLPEMAHDRCVAQIAEALFGQPGMTLMEIANRREEIEQMAKDARRYRWLRNDANGASRHSPAVLADGPTDECTFLFTETLDKAVDSEMAAMKEQAE